MKRNLYFAALAAVLFASCDKPAANAPDDLSELVRLDLSFTSGQTKSVGTNDENTINSVQVYVFDSKGAIEAYNMEQFSNPVSVSSASTSVECTPGTKTLIALVNAPQMNDISSLDNLKGKVSQLSDNGLRNLHMSGQVSKDITGETEVTIPVSRIAAKVRLASISNQMSLDYYKGLPFYITDMYMINVSGNTGYLEDAAATSWYNKRGKTDNGAMDVMLTRRSTSPLAVSRSETLRLGQELEPAYYVYPNFTENDTSDPEWCPRYTRLVLEARLGEETYYYPVSIPDIERNTAYEVHLTVTRPGSSSPDIPVDVHTAAVTVNVVDWIDAADVNETI